MVSNDHMHTGSNKRSVFLALPFAADDVRRYDEVVK